MAILFACQAEQKPEGIHIEIVEDKLDLAACPIDSNSKVSLALNKMKDFGINSAFSKCALVKVFNYHKVPVSFQIADSTLRVYDTFYFFNDGEEGGIIDFSASAYNWKRELKSYTIQPKASITMYLPYPPFLDEFDYEVSYRLHRKDTLPETMNKRLVFRTDSITQGVKFVKVKDSKHQGGWLKSVREEE
ncbi:MAG: hypothetical protein ACFB0B_17865 [Thermonemataceae bacterium]